MTDIELCTRTPDGNLSHDTTSSPPTRSQTYPAGGGLLWAAKTLATRNLSGLTVEQLDCVPASVEYLHGNRAVVRHRLGAAHPNYLLTISRLARKGVTVILNFKAAA